MTDMTSAIAARLQAQRDEKAASRSDFTVDPHLERLGEHLDLIREHSPAELHQYAATAQQVSLYRRRKADHDRNDD